MGKFYKIGPFVQGTKSRDTVFNAGYDIKAKASDYFCKDLKDNSIRVIDEMELKYFLSQSEKYEGKEQDAIDWIER